MPRLFWTLEIYENNSLLVWTFPGTIKLSVDSTYYIKKKNVNKKYNYGALAMATCFDNQKK